MPSEQSSNQRADDAMNRYATGDDAAFGDLYDSLAPRLYRLALAKVKDKTRAEDLVQQTLLQMHRARGRFVKGSMVTPWAFAILNRLFIDQVRRKHVELFTSSGNDDTRHPSDKPGPEESAYRREVERLVQEQLTNLSPQQQCAFELVFFGQMSHGEAAESLGTTVASVKLRIQRATQALRSALGNSNSIEVDDET
jgi:RNA polymerase sigma-70 factor, ECF subfamily